MLNSLIGFSSWRIVVIPEPTATIQARTHRKKRIDKKWRKRYGFKTIIAKYDKGKMFVNEREMIAYCYPHHEAELRRQLQVSI